MSAAIQTDRHPDDEPLAVTLAELLAVIAEVTPRTRSSRPCSTWWRPVASVSSRRRWRTEPARSSGSVLERARCPRLGLFGNLPREVSAIPVLAR